MSTLRIHGIEAKSDPTSASVNEKIKITNSNGDLLLHLDGTQAGIGTVGITTTGTTFHVDRATGEITFVTDAKFNVTIRFNNSSCQYYFEYHSYHLYNKSIF